MPTDETAMEPTFYLSKREAARYLAISLRTLDAWMAKGLVPFVKIEKTVRFRRIDLETNVGVLFAARN